MLLKLENTVTHSVNEFDVEDINGGKKLYYQFNINAFNLDDGEYKLTLINNGEAIYEDILRIGDYNTKTLQYSKGNNTFIQTIGTQQLLQIKNEQIDDVTTTIYPDEGYDGMTEVNIDAQPLYTTAYSDGYYKGKADGAAEGIDLSFIGYNSEDSMDVVNRLVFNPAMEAEKYYLDWDESRTDAREYFRGLDNLAIAPYINTENVKSMDGTFEDCTNLRYVPLLNTARVNYFDNAFRGCKSLTTVPLFNTISAFSMRYMFHNCDSLQTVPLFRTQNVEDMQGMFENCDKLQSVPLFNTRYVTNFGYMFKDCKNLQSVPQFNTANGNFFYYMFYNCDGLQTVPSFNLNNAVRLDYMFGTCGSLQTVGKFTAPNATTVESIFGACFNLETIGSYTHYLDLENCSVTSYMFQNCYSLRELPIINCPSISTESAFFGSTYYLYDLVEVGGCISKHNQNGTNKWARCPNLSQGSIQRIIDCLYDFIGNGSTTRKGVSFNTNSQPLVTDEMIAQATAKGWTIDFKSPSHSN